MRCGLATTFFDPCPKSPFRAITQSVRRPGRPLTVHSCQHKKIYCIAFEVSTSGKTPANHNSPVLHTKSSVALQVKTKRVDVCLACFSHLHRRSGKCPKLGPDIFSTGPRIRILVNCTGSKSSSTLSSATSMSKTCITIRPTQYYIYELALLPPSNFKRGSRSRFQFSPVLVFTGLILLVVLFKESGYVLTDDRIQHWHTQETSTNCRRRIATLRQETKTSTG